MLLCNERYSQLDTQKDKIQLFKMMNVFLMIFFVQIFTHFEFDGFLPEWQGQMSGELLGLKYSETAFSLHY